MPEHRRKASSLPAYFEIRPRSSRSASAFVSLGLLGAESPDRHSFPRSSECGLIEACRAGRISLNSDKFYPEKAGCGDYLVVNRMRILSGKDDDFTRKWNGDQLAGGP